MRDEFKQAPGRPPQGPPARLWRVWGRIPGRFLPITGGSLPHRVMRGQSLS